MAKGNRPVEVRVDDETRARWETAARDAGYSLSEYVREAVDARVDADAPKPKPKRAKKGAAPETPARAARAGMCEHRRPATTYCPKCDG